MNRQRLLHTVLLSLYFTLGHSQETLNNQSVLDLVRLGLSEQIILSKIKASSNDYDMSINQLLALKQAGATDAIIAAMLDADNDESKKVYDLNDYHSPHRPGIYYYDATNQLVELLPTVTTALKTRNALGAHFSYGIAKMKMVSQVPGMDARTQFASVPKFYFYFNQQTASFDESMAGYAFASATSPNEFQLAKLAERKGVREMLVASGNAFTHESGLDEEQIRPFGMKQVGPGIFEVEFTQPAVGEYCFVYSGSAAGSGGQHKVYDFGIQ